MSGFLYYLHTGGEKSEFKANQGNRIYKIWVHILPLHSINQDGSCTCMAGHNCESKAKNPMFKGWYDSATLSEAGAVTQGMAAMQPLTIS